MIFPPIFILKYERIYLIVIFFIASFLLLCNIGNQYLWQDEAETASLAKNVSRFGLPRAFDGKNTILMSDSSNNPEDYLYGKLWRGQPWLGIYVANVSFTLFGANTFTARLPFAFLGIFSVFLAYLLTKRLFSDRAVSNLTILLLTFSVPFILHARQCRYYSLGISLTLLSIYFYLDYLAQKKLSMAKLLLALFLLLNTSISYYLSVITGIACHLFFVNKKNFFGRKNLLFFLTAASFSIPILYLMKLSRRSSLDIDWIMHNIRYYLRSINGTIFPWMAFCLLYALLAIKNKRLNFVVPKKERGAVYLLLIFIVCNFPYLVFVDFNSLRYVIHVAPLFFMLEAYILARLMRKFRTFVFALMPIIVFTNLLNFSLPVQSYFFKYLYEITHDYDGPIEGIIKYLKKNANPGDTVKITYGDNACIFYTGLEVNNKLPFDDWSYPEWIIPRRHWNQKDFYDSDYSKETERRYEKIVLPYPDIPWENRPDDLGYHKFRTDTSAAKVVIYKRR